MIQNAHLGLSKSTRLNSLNWIDLKCEEKKLVLKAGPVNTDTSLERLK